MGKDDYTKRLEFYVEHVLSEKPMDIDNIDYQMSFIQSEEAGKFMAHITELDFEGAVNGASAGTISIREILRHIEAQSGKKAFIDVNGAAAPYNGMPEYSINTNKAEETGYKFTHIKNWIFDVVDFYIEQFNDRF